MIKLLRRVGIALAAVLVICAGIVMIAGPARFPRMMATLGLPQRPGAGGWADVQVGGPFTLVDGATGNLVTEALYRGRWMLIYFGYTFCPDVCPTDLQKMVGALASMGQGADRITPIFITVDPARDTPTTIAQYVALFSPKLVGLTGSAAQIDAAVRAYRVYVRKLPPPSSAGGGGYLIDHSAFIYLMDPQGKLAAIFPPDIKMADFAHTLARDVVGSPAS